MESDSGYSTPNSPRQRAPRHQQSSSPLEEIIDYTDYILSDEEVCEFFDAEEDDIEVSKIAVPSADLQSSAFFSVGIQEEQEEDDEGDADDEGDDSSRPNRPRAASAPVSPSWGRTRSRESTMLLIEEELEDDPRPWRGRRGRRGDSASHLRSGSGPPVSKALLRYLRSWGRQSEESMEGSGPIHFGSMQFENSTTDMRTSGSAAIEDPVEPPPEDSTSEEESLVDDEDSIDSWWDDEEDSDMEISVEWSEMPPLPLRFLLDTSTQSQYLDPSMMNQTMTEQEGERFVWEHGILLKALLQLLFERDQIGVEGALNVADNIWKKGPLKKFSSQKWKVKYVELRQGNLCYYEDSGHVGRKIIHLRQADTVVQERPGRGYSFEVAVQGSPVRLWMARSEEERQGWIRAIQAAMIGSDDPRRELDLTPHREALEVYTTLREQLQKVDTHEDYVVALKAAVQDTLQVPVQWIRDQLKRAGTSKESTKMAPHKRIKTSIHEFWKNMASTSFAINGLLVPRNTPLASERILGTLTRCILEYDKAFTSEEVDETEFDPPTGLISELQAVSHARYILMTVLRSKEQQDAAYAVTHLLGNPELVVVHPHIEEEVVHMEVSFAGEDLPDDFSQAGTEIVGWVRTRRKHNVASKWRRRFAVLSGGVLSYYEAASPRPHGLRGQLVLGGATVQEEESDADDTWQLCISTAAEDRLLSFETKSEFDEWKDAVQLAIDSVIPEGETPTPRQRKSILKGAERVIQRAIPDPRMGIRAIKGATGGGIKVVRSATGGSIKVIRGMFRPKTSDGQQPSGAFGMQRRPSMRMLMNNTVALNKREPTVQCVVQATQSFDILEHCYTDTAVPGRLMSVRTKLFQAFLMSGGPGGRIAKGDALMELEFLDSIFPEVDTEAD